ncbi:MAG: helix-turn-helix domain-containing protein [Bryobacteraceae bacterium]|nr:helix-turn-helix domain-containing protein [Bryobacteraceae bacterium]
MSPQQAELLSCLAPPSGTVSVNDSVCFRTEDGQRVISVRGVIFAHYSVEDRTAEAYAMVTLWESEYATQTQLAQAFGYSDRSLRRYQERFAAEGMRALLRPPGRPAGRVSGRPHERGRDQTILRLKAKGASNRAIAGKLGLSEKAVRKRLRRLGWQPQTGPTAAGLLFEEDPAGEASATAEVIKNSIGVAPKAVAAAEQFDRAHHSILSASVSRAPDPLERSLDRLLAAMGLIEDADPVFAPAENLPRAGVLLAIPALVASGVLSVARKIYGSIGPAFYGLRTTLVAYILLALLRIPRPETLKEYAPGELGRIVGLDRVPEVKTLRRKLERLALRKASQEFGRELAQRRIAERGRMIGFLYVDGHVRAYHGQRAIPQSLPRPDPPCRSGDHRLLGERSAGGAAIGRDGGSQRRADADAEADPCRDSGIDRCAAARHDRLRPGRMESKTLPGAAGDGF